MLAEGVCRADADLHGGARRRRDRPLQLLASERVLHGSRKSPMSSRTSSPRSRPPTPTRRPKSKVRAQGHLARIEAEFDDQRKALGVSDDLKEIGGLTTPMLVRLGENGVKTLEDLGDCASDDLVGDRWRRGEARLSERLRRIHGRRLTR